MPGTDVSFDAPVADFGDCLYGVRCGQAVDVGVGRMILFAPLDARSGGWLALSIEG